MDVSEPIRLEYRAPSGCPDEAAMVSRIRTRTDVRMAVGVERARTFVVTINADGPRVIGTITSVNALGEPSARALGGADCTEVVDALALVAAMTLHPELQANEAPAGAREPVPAAANVPPVAAVPTPRPPEAIAREVDGNSGASESPRVEANRFHLQGGGLAELTFGYVPTVLLGTSARVELLDVSQRVVNSAFGIAVSAVRPTERTFGDASASLTWTLGQLTACPVHFGLSSSISLLPCGRLDAGRLNAVGQNIAHATGRNLFWSSAGVLAKIAWIPVRPLVVDWQGAVLLPLTPYEFVFEPSSVLYGAPWIGFSTSVGVGLMFL
jgi:hypothetical protein